MNTIFMNGLFFICSLLFLSVSKAEAVIVTNTIEIRMSIEDAEMKSWAVTCVKFDGEEIDLSEKTFMHRIVRKKFNLVPGSYELEWSVERSETPWGEKEKATEKRMIVLELTDALVHLVIRGNNLTTY